MITMQPKHFDILKTILSSYPYTFYVFGSRITAFPKTLSDVDIFYKDTIPDRTLGELEEKLEESDLPYKVDLVDYHHCDEAFKKIMDAQYVIFPK